MEGQIDLVKKKQAAIRLLSGDNRPRSRSIRQQIEEIDLASATSRELVRFNALCSKVAKFYSADLRDTANTPS